MIDVIEVKETMEDTIAAFPSISDSFGDIKEALSVLNGLLAEEKWMGDTKVKCQQIQGLLEEYTDDMTELIQELHQETVLLWNHTQEFVSNSECISIISSI